MSIVNSQSRFPIFSRTKTLFRTFCAICKIYHTWCRASEMTSHLKIFFIAKHMKDDKWSKTFSLIFLATDTTWILIVSVNSPVLYGPARTMKFFRLVNLFSYMYRKLNYWEKFRLNSDCPI